MSHDPGLPFDAEKIRMVHFVNKNFPINIRDSKDFLPARPNADIQRGYDIYFVTSERRYHIHEIIDGKILKVLYVHESRVEFAEKWM